MSIRKLVRNIRKMEEVQTLIGRAMAAYQDDRSPDRNEKVMGALQRAFDLMIELRSNT